MDKRMDKLKRDIENLLNWKKYDNILDAIILSLAVFSGLMALGCIIALAIGYMSLDIVIILTVLAVSYSAEAIIFKKNSKKETKVEVNDIPEEAAGELIQMLQKTLKKEIIAWSCSMPAIFLGEIVIPMIIFKLMQNQLKIVSMLPLILCFLLSLGLTLGFGFSASWNYARLSHGIIEKKVNKIKSLQNSKNTTYKKFIIENHDQNISVALEAKNFAEKLDKAYALIGEDQVKKDIRVIRDSMTDIYAMAENSEPIEKQIRKFGAHYMPMTLKLLNMYIDTSRKRMQTTETKHLKAEISGMIGEVNTAFCKLNSELFAQASMDSEVHIEAFKNILESDGLLSDNEMNIYEK